MHIFFCSFSRVSTFPSLELTLLELTKTCAVEPHFTLPLADCWWWTWARMMRSLNRSWLRSQVRTLSLLQCKTVRVTDSLSKPFGLGILISLSLENYVKLVIVLEIVRNRQSCFAERASDARWTCEWHSCSGHRLLSFAQDNTKPKIVRLSDPPYVISP